MPASPAIASSAETPIVSGAMETSEWSREFPRAALDGLSTHIAVLDPRGTILVVNQAWSAFAQARGLPPERAGVGINYLQVCDKARGAEAEEAALFAAQTRDVIAGQRPFFEMEYACHGPEERRWFLARVTPLAWRNLRGAIVAHHETTERKLAEERLKRTLQELEDSNRHLEEFAYVASHDLQEPLRAVAGCLQLLRLGYQGRLDARADEFIGHAVEGAERMQALIEDLLEYSRVGRRGKPFEPVDCDALFRQILLNLAASLAETGASVTADELPVLRADPIQLLQVLQNLVANAVKFRRPDLPPQIHVSARVCAPAEAGVSEWEFSVRDNGIGIEPRHFERIFEIFQRLHTRVEYPGTGMGLAICKRIVERHGGRIWVESAPGQGAVFHFTVQEQPPR